MTCARCGEPFPRAALTDHRGELLCPRDMHNLALEQMAHREVHVPTVQRASQPVPVASEPRARLRAVKKARGIEPVTTGGLL